MVGEGHFIGSGGRSCSTTKKLTSTGAASKKEDVTDLEDNRSSTVTAMDEALCAEHHGSSQSPLQPCQSIDQQESARMIKSGFTSTTLTCPNGWPASRETSFLPSEESG